MRNLIFLYFRLSSCTTRATTSTFYIIGFRRHFFFTLGPIQRPRRPCLHRRAQLRRGFHDVGATHEQHTGHRGLCGCVWILLLFFIEAVLGWGVYSWDGARHPGGFTTSVQHVSNTPGIEVYAGEWVWKSNEWRYRYCRLSFIYIIFLCTSVSANLT